MSRAAIKTKQLIILIFTAGLIGAGVLFFTNNKDNQPIQPTVQQSQPAPVQDKPIVYDGEAGKTALELLKAKFQAQTKDSAYGEFVTTIEGREGNGPKYWAFYINGKLSQVGAGDYKTVIGDKLEWKLE